MTTNNNQPEDKAPTFTKGQEVWLKAIIETGVIHSDGDIGFTVKSVSNKNILHYCLSSEVRTTEQLLLDHGASTPQNNLESTFEETKNESMKNWEWDDEDEAWLPKTANVGGETPHNAEQDAEPTTILTETETVTEPDRTRKFRKGDKVKRREELLFGRDLSGFHPLLPHGETLIVETDEDSDGAVGIFYGGLLRYVSFLILDLVEPAPEKKYKLVEKTREYQIYDTQKGQTKASFSNEIYTFEEVQAECARLNQKDQDDE